MGLSANTVWEVRPGGNDTNGGGFVNGATGTDYSVQDAKNTGANDKSVTDGVTAGTTTVTSATANFGTTIVGNIIYVSGGTGSITAGWYQVTARASTTSITVDRSTGLTAGTGVTINIGGAFASPAVAMPIAVNGNVVFIYNAGATVYSITTASTNVAAGSLAPAGNIFIVGYATNRTLNNTDAAPTLQLNVTTATVFLGGGSHAVAFNLILDGNNQTTSKATTQTNLWRCTIKNMTGASAISPVYAAFCLATANSANPVFAGAKVYVGCEAYSNTATGFGGAHCINCLAYNNTGASTDGFQGGPNMIIIGCTAYANGRDNFRAVSNANVMIGNASENAVANGFNGVNLLLYLLNNEHFGNATAIATNTNPNAAAFGTVAASASVFVGAGTNNFALVNNPSVRGAGYGTFQRGTTVAYPDIGAAQHADPVVPQTARIYGE